MPEKSNHISENVYSILHELLVPLKSLAAAYPILSDKVPQTIEEPFHLFGEISNELLLEVLALFQEPSKKIDLQSADIASEQIRLLSSEWKKNVERLSQFAAQINGKNIHLEDDSLDRILQGVLSKKGFEKLDKMVWYLTQVQAEHLTTDDGFFYVLHIERPIP